MSATSSSISVQLGYCLPTQENLDLLLEKLEPFFKENLISSHLLQQESKSLAASRTRHHGGPMSGNDFHIRRPSNPSSDWEAMVQLETDTETTVADKTDRAVELLRASWPNATISLLQRRQIGQDIYNPDLPGIRLFEWLASKELDLRENVQIKDLWISEGVLQEFLGRQYRGIELKPFPELERRRLAVSSPAPENGPILERPPDSQIWTFNRADSWFMSFPVLATILLLMTNPTKKGHMECPCREFSWCLDLIHGYCLQKGPGDIGDPCSWSLGTFSDCWIYLQFIFHSFTPRDTLEPQDWKGTGMPCDYHILTLAMERRNISFREVKTWLGIRTATSSYKGESHANHPSTVGFVVSEQTHFMTNAAKYHWIRSGLESTMEASGVALFQLLLFHGVDDWCIGWNDCLDHIESLHDVEDDVLTGKHPEQLRTLVLNPSGQLAKDYSLTANLLKNFRKHIEYLPQSLRQLRRKWESTYLGHRSDRLERFDGTSRRTLLLNWDKVIIHADGCHVGLLERVDKRVDDLLRRRDSLNIAKGSA